MPQISIVSVAYRSEETIRPFLDAISKSKGSLSLEVIIVNNLMDNTTSIARSHRLKPTVIQNQANVGFSKAINQALQLATGEYVLILNPDTRLKGKCLDRLYRFALRTKHLGAVAPKLLNDNGKIQPSVFKFPTLLNAIKKYFFGCNSCFDKYFPGNQTTRVDVAVMAALLIPRPVITRIGGLDEKYFLYYEDIEYCRRLARNHLGVYYYPKAVAYHQHGASGKFVSHLKSPLLASAIIYHGRLGSYLLNLVLNLGQKFQKFRKLVTRPI